MMGATWETPKPRVGPTDVYKDKRALVLARHMQEGVSNGMHIRILVHRLDLNDWLSTGVVRGEASHQQTLRFSKDIARLQSLTPRGSGLSGRALVGLWTLLMGSWGYVPISG